MDGSFWNIPSLLQEVGGLAGGRGGVPQVRPPVSLALPLALSAGPEAVRGPEGCSERRRWPAGPLARCPPSSCLAPVRPVAAGRGSGRPRVGRCHLPPDPSGPASRGLDTGGEKGCLQIPFPCPSDGVASEPHRSWGRGGWWVRVGACGLWESASAVSLLPMPAVWTVEGLRLRPGAAVLRTEGP